MLRTLAYCSLLCFTLVTCHGHWIFFTRPFLSELVVIRKMTFHATIIVLDAPLETSSLWIIIALASQDSPLLSAFFALLRLCNLCTSCLHNWFILFGWRVPLLHPFINTLIIYLARVIWISNRLSKMLMSELVKSVQISIKYLKGLVYYIIYWKVLIVSNGPHIQQVILEWVRLGAMLHLSSLGKHRFCVGST